MRFTINTSIVMVSLLVASTADAQVPGSFRDLHSLMRTGDGLTITDRAGEVTKGRLLAVADRSLRIRSESGPRDVAEASVATIERVRSRTRKGMLIGLVSGAVIGAVAVTVTSSGGFDRGQFILPAALLFGGLGAGVGAAVGVATPEHRVVFQVSNPPVRTP